MIPGIILLIVMILMVVFISKQVRKGQRSAYEEAFTDPATDAGVPDMPLNFGHKGMWFAVKATDAQRIAAILNITQLSESNWHVGIDKAYKDAVFITPPVDGWTLVFGVAFPYDDTGDDLADVKKKLQELSKEFGEAQFFSTNRVVEFHSWMRAKDGVVERVYVYVADDGAIAAEGTPDTAEQQYNIAEPDEDTVMGIAGKWSVDPSALEERTDLRAGFGWTGS